MTIGEYEQLSNIRIRIREKISKYILMGQQEVEEDLREIYRALVSLSPETETVGADPEEETDIVKNPYGETVIFVRCCDGFVDALKVKEIKPDLRGGKQIFKTHSGIVLNYCPICGVKIVIKNRK